MEHRVVFRVTEGHLFEADLATGPARRWPGICSLGDLRLVEHLEHPLRTGRGRGQVGGERRQRRHRAVYGAGVADEHEHLAGG